MSLDIAIGHKLTSWQEAFVDLVADGADTSDAIVKAGYTGEKPHKEAWRLMRQPQIVAAIQIRAGRELALGAPRSIKLLRRFVEEEKWDARVRLAAAKTILDRAGFIPPRAADPRKAGETPLNEMSMTELRTLADKLEGEIAGRAKEVSSATPAPGATQAIDDII